MKFSSGTKTLVYYLLLYLSHAGWNVVERHIVAQFGQSRDFGYRTFIDLLDNLVPVTLDIILNHTYDEDDFYMVRKFTQERLPERRPATEADYKRIEHLYTKSHFTGRIDFTDNHFTDNYLTEIISPTREFMIRVRVRKFSHKAQLETHTSLTDEAIVAETYNTVSDDTYSEPKVNNDMDIDKNLEKEIVVSPNSDTESRDPISANKQTPINTESDDMITDLPNKDTNGAIAPGSSNTQNTQQQNNDEITRSILIFKENTSTTNCQYFIFFTKDQFDANKSNNEIINSIKNAFLTIHHAIGYKYQKKATLEFFTVQINNEECYNNIVDKPIALLNNITPRPYSKDLIDQLIAAKLNKIEECTVKLANVPFNYDVNLLIKHFANFTKQSIASFKEIKPNLKRRRPLDNRNTQRSQSPTYKQVIITFDKKSAVEYLFAQHKWGI
ncbi:hypothetical protein RhiirA5_503287, partial [Rhizophagus irregularis]